MKSAIIGAISCAGWILLTTFVRVDAGDWPNYRRDVRRSGFTTENLRAENLRESWVFRSPQTPRPAWPGPAKWDAYANIRGLRSMRDYDVAFQIVVAGDSLFYGSSVDDAVHCLNTLDGSERWRFVTDAPIRIAPTVTNNRVYFGSDDGHAYCVSAMDGMLIWKSAAVQNEHFILNDGRFISQWPCRTGVLVSDGIAYYGLSLLPWQQSYLCAVDSETGASTGPGRFIQHLANQTLEGGILLHNDALITLRGRVAPFAFNRGDGSEIGDFKDGGGGVFATLNTDGELLHGPGNKTGWITRSGLSSLKKIDMHAGFTAVVPLKEQSVFLSDDGVTAVKNATGAAVWQTVWPKPADIIVAGNAAYVGGDGEVGALQLTDGERLWQTTVNGRASGLVVADDALFVSTEDGAIYCFRAGDTPTIPTTEKQPDANEPPERPSATIAISPPAEFQSRDGLVGQWTIYSGMGERARRRGLSSPERRVQNPAGSLDGVISGNVHLREVGGVEALELDGNSNSIIITDNHTMAGLPTQAISAEAWVSVNTPLRWGGIAGAIQDDGSVEHGWLLGYQDSKFSFAVAATEGPDSLTYLRGKTDFEPQLWYHVVGTYDGTTQNLYVNGQLENTAVAQKGTIRYPAQTFFELGAYHDSDEYYRMTGMLHEVLIYDRALTPQEIAAHHAVKRGEFAVPVRLAMGPVASFTGTDRAVIQWSTARPSPTILDFSGHGDVQQIHDAVPRTDHHVILKNLQQNRVGHYVIKTEMDGEIGVSQEFELDTSFNYSQPAIVGRPQFSTAESSQVESLARQILNDTSIDKGLCLVVGIHDGALAFELARQSNLNVVCVDTDLERVESVRQIVASANEYGTRVSARHVSSLSQLPFIGRCINLIVSERQLFDGDLLPDAKEIYRILRPFGGIAHFEWPAGNTQPTVESLREWLSPATSEFTISQPNSRLRAQIVRAPLKGSGEWSHLYGLADNSAFGGESLSGASTTDELQVQWIGRPGPRAQPDRNGRKPSPLSTNGRLFVQGLHRLLGVDALNGTPLWSLEIPSLERFNMPRDCGNWCADDDHVYVAVRDKCWQIDAQTGAVIRTHDVHSGERVEWNYDWSYLARVGDILLGSAVKQGTAYTNFWGNADAGWYDAESGSATYKVCSENLFAINPQTSERKWTYANGVILNATITATAEHVYFIECRNPVVKASASRRVGLPELWQNQFLVALNSRTGEFEWEQPIDTADGIVVFNMALGGDRLILSSSGSKQYDVYAFSATSGQQLWEQKFGWLNGKGDHGKAMSRPAIVGDSVYVRPHALDLRTGAIQSLTMPGGGCGTYAATTNALFFRSGNVTAWNTKSGSTTSWSRLRPDCWLSTIPANGMLLSPEAGGGCSCGSWLETSIGFIPTRE